MRLSTGLNAATVSVSAKGNRLAYANFSRTANVWSLPIPRSGTASLSRGPAGDDRQPGDRGVQSVVGYALAGVRLQSGRRPADLSDVAAGRGRSVGAADQRETPSLAPAFSFDGREVVFHSFRDGVRQIFVIPVEGGTPVQVTSERATPGSRHWSPDGRTIAFVRNALTPDQETAIVTRDQSGSGALPEPWSREGGCRC